jgi:outer membrane protein OmpA-like peptidoglycan-associated protein
LRHVFKDHPMRGIFQRHLRRHVVRVLLLVPLCGWAQDAAIPTYTASMMQSHWDFRDAAGGCRLTHPVPGFGRAALQQDAGGALTLVLEPQRPAAGPLRCRVSVGPPPWRHGQPPVLLEELETAARVARITVSGTSAQVLYRGLNDGLLGRFECRASGEGGRGFTVELSPVHYQEAAAHFRACVEKLAVKKRWRAKAEEALAQGLTVLFPAGSSRLSSAARADLKRFAGFCTAYPGFRFLELAGYADPQGSRSEKQQLSRQRAEAVQAYLIRQGVPSGKLQLRFFGGGRPAVAANDAAALARDRRVQITPIY